MAELAVLAPIASAVGAGVSAVGTLMGGGAAQAGSEYKARQYEQAATDARAVGQRGQFEKQRETRFLQSKLQARAAASGAGAADPTIVELGGNIAGRGEYESLLEMYKGENRARGYEDAASGARIEGSARARASELAALGTLIGAAGSIGSRYAPRRAGEPLSLDPDDYTGPVYR